MSTIDLMKEIICASKLIALSVGWDSNRTPDLLLFQHHYNLYLKHRERTLNWGERKCPKYLSDSSV
ncbi:hypothetical protein SPI02_14860 [Staphylococcus piscifermentans]|uniref:Uncharacterized protein n=1 Tax=Staphylococcus piscifermentans TaxID=70258 RepID=A0A512QN74_9STAP|nr:hypothetical protein SPI02_14860 [Staphylococcus piscifermentans]